MSGSSENSTTSAFWPAVTARLWSPDAPNDWVNVMFFPAVWSWFPLLRACPSVVTLHDAIAERVPQLVFPDRRGRLLWTLKVRLAQIGVTVARDSTHRG